MVPHVKVGCLMQVGRRGKHQLAMTWKRVSVTRIMNTKWTDFPNVRVVTPMMLVWKAVLDRNNTGIIRLIQN